MNLLDATVVEVAAPVSPAAEVILGTASAAGRLLTARARRAAAR
ncbi:hypothetical protein [Streptomyces pseudovenezuelae]|nr:hypothetical protein [Streptomyces pseudovenezuelae]